jgi:hypothetical protein
VVELPVPLMPLVPELRRAKMAASLSSEQKAALAALFQAAFALGYRQGLKAATAAENEVLIRETLREAVYAIRNGPIEPNEPSTTAHDLRDHGHPENFDKTGHLVE